jgi:ribosome-binding factor A
MGKRRDRRTSRSSAHELGDGGRTTRLQELIRQEVNFLLRGEIRDPRLRGVEITMVELAGERARLWFTAEDTEDKSEALDRAAGYLRTELAASLGLKRTPELRFRRDPATRAFARGPQGD